MTLELSQKGFSDAAEALCWNTMINTLLVADSVGSGTAIDALAERKQDFTFLTTAYTEPFDAPEKALTSGLVNFQAVAAGQPLHAQGSPAMLAPEDGVILFPKYPKREAGVAVAPWPNEIYRLVTPMQTHPMDQWGET